MFTNYFIVRQILSRYYILLKNALVLYLTVFYQFLIHEMTFHRNCLCVDSNFFFISYYYFLGTFLLNFREQTVTRMCS